MPYILEVFKLNPVPGLTPGKYQKKFKSQVSFVEGKIIVHHLRGCSQGKNCFIILPCKPAGILLHINWILIYTSINAPGNLIIAKFINLRGNCRYNPRGTSQGNTVPMQQPHSLMGLVQGDGRQEEWGSPPGASQRQAEDSVPWKSLREPGTLHEGAGWVGQARIAA